MKNINILYLKILKKNDKVNLTFFNTLENNIYLKNKSGKWWKKNRIRAAKFLVDLPQQLPDIKCFWTLLQMFYFEDIGLYKLQLE